jgi:hypothetical protein
MNLDEEGTLHKLCILGMGKNPDEVFIQREECFVLFIENVQLNMCMFISCL